MNQDALNQVVVGAVSLAVSREAQIRAEILKIGDPVRVMIKPEYSNDAKVHTGVIVGFEPFEESPAVIIAYIEESYSKAEMKTLYYTKASKGVEVIAAAPGIGLATEREKVLEFFESERKKKLLELDTLAAQRDYFEKHFGRLFEQIEHQAA